MGDKLKQSVAGFLGGLIAFAGLFGISAIVKDEPEYKLPADFDISQHIDLDSLRGEDGKDGARGWAGTDGDDGVNGIDGLTGSDGKDGEDADVNLDELVDDVIDELDNRDEDSEYYTSGDEGDYTRSFQVDDSGYFDFVLKHFGSGEFEVTLELEDGATISLVDAEGHVNTDYTGIYLDDDDENKLHVSADGDWSIEVEEN